MQNQIGFRAENGNHTFLDVITDGENQFPAGMGLHAGGEFFTKFTTKIIPVTSGIDTNSRPIEAMNLLDAMGIGRNTLHFSSSFNIFKITRIPGIPTSSYTFYIPNQRVNYGQGASYICWSKGKGGNYGSNTETWTQNRFIWEAGTNPGAYLHIDYYLTGDDAEVYLALPTIVSGIWPEHKPLGVLYSK